MLVNPAPALPTRTRRAAGGCDFEAERRRPPLAYALSCARSNRAWSQAGHIAETAPGERLVVAGCLRSRVKLPTEGTFMLRGGADAFDGDRGPGRA